MQVALCLLIRFLAQKGKGCGWFIVGILTLSAGICLLDIVIYQWGIKSNCFRSRRTLAKLIQFTHFYGPKFDSALWQDDSGAQQNKHLASSRGPFAIGRNDSSVSRASPSTRGTHVSAQFSRFYHQNFANRKHNAIHCGQTTNRSLQSASAHACALPLWLWGLFFVFRCPRPLFVFQ